MAAEHYWNGKWGRVARRDVIITNDGQVWTVEARDGGPEGRRSTFRAADEPHARAIAHELMTDSDRWRQVPPS